MMDGVETIGLSGDAMFRLVTSKEVDNRTKQQALKQFKADAKHGKVNLEEVSRYFEALAVAVDISHESVPLLAFSALTTLVKVTAISNKRDTLKQQLFLVLPIIIHKLGDNNIDIKARAKKSLEDCWLTSHSQTSQLIMELAIPNRNPAVALETINWINNFLINSNPQLNIGSLIPSLLHAIEKYSKSSNNRIVYAIINLLTNFCNMKDNFRFKYKISKELDDFDINDDLKEKIENSIGINDMTFNNSSNPTSSKLKLDVKSDFMKPKAQTGRLPSKYSQHSNIESKPSSLHHAMALNKEEETHSQDLPSTVERANTDPELESITNKLSGYKFDESLGKTNVSCADELYYITNSLLPPFANKETESNWTAREKNIVKLRALIRGNAATEYLEDLRTCIKDLSDGICKAMSSLRTTLSNNGCQLIKELTTILQGSVDSLVDMFLPTLLKLCSATKNITSVNAHVAICSILIGCSYSFRYMQKIFNASIDKNIKIRSYSATWLRIMMIRFHDSSSFLNASSSQHSQHSQTSSGFEITIKSLTKLLSDPNPTVRLTAKEAYWSFMKYFSHESEALTSRLEPNILKAIERSKPISSRTSSSSTNSNFSSINRSNSRTSSSRPSLRDSIIAKNKELRAKHRDDLSHSHSASSSRAPSRMGSERGQRGSLNQNNIVNNSLSQNNRKEETKERGNSKYQPKPFPNTTIQRQSSITKREKLEIPRGNNEEDFTLKSESGKSSDELVSQKDKLDISKARVLDSPGTLEAIHSNFDKSNDPMKAFLRSNSFVENEHGIDLLKYAIDQNEDIDPNEFKMPLLKIANLRVEMLKPLFKFCSLEKLYQFFKPEDFFRVCILVLEAADEKFVDNIISIFDLNDIYKSIDTLLGYCISLEHLQDDDSLGTQIIRYKSQIMYMIFHFMLISLNKIPISDKYFSSIVSTLFELTSLAKSTKLYEPLSNLLHKLHSINQSLFTTELTLKDSQMVSEIGTIIDLDNLTEFTTNNATYDFTTTNFANLTKVVPSSDNNIKGSPFKGTSDLTMLMPVGFSTDNDYKFKSIKSGSKLGIAEEAESTSISLSLSDKMEIDNLQNDDARLNSHNTKNYSLRESPTIVETNPHFDFEGNGSTKQSSNVSEEQRNNEENVFFKPHEHHEQHERLSMTTKVERPKSKDALIDEFSQVKITEKLQMQQQGADLDQKESLLSFIDKVDPLKTISEKNKQIDIYEDRDRHGQNGMDTFFGGSPNNKRNKSYDYTELNWFNFQLAKFPKDFENDVSKLEFETLCHKLGRNSIEIPEFLKLFNYLQNCMKFDMDFTNYYYGEGKKIIEKNLWDFFESYEQLSQTKILNGLILLKQLLINRVKLDLAKLFSLLVNLSLLKDNLINEYNHAINEIFEEILTGPYSKRELLSQILQHLPHASVNDPTNKLLFVFECTLKILSFNFVAQDSNLENETVYLINEHLNKFLDHKQVEVRRLVILNYGKLLKSFDSNFNNRFGEDTMKDTIFGKLTVPQKKLVEYYAQM